MSRALEDVAAERRRQIEVEGWSVRHDDQSRLGELAFAAAAYAVGPSARMEGPPIERPGAGHLHRVLWPWAWEFWKPRSRREDLVRAGALILAEIERLDRAEASK